MLNKIMITRKSDKLNIDNEKLSIQQLKDKLREEFEEVRVENNPKLLALELMDVIQISINMLYKLTQLHKLNMMDIIKQHNLKLIKRGWKSAKDICFLVVDKHE